MKDIILQDINKNKLVFYPQKEAIDAIYYQKARVPNPKQVKSSLEGKSDPKIKKYFQAKGIEKGIKTIRKTLSKIGNKIPLYDEYSRNVYLIDKSNVYNRIVYRSYRFPDENLLELLRKRRGELAPEVKEMGKTAEKNLGDFDKSSKIHYVKSTERELRKLDLMIDFLEQFDLDVLQDTYVKAFYYCANEVGKNITVCLRPSFLPHFSHIDPYYSRTELINMALNMGIIKPDAIFYDSERLMELCEKIKKNDISAKTILAHQKHIIKKNMIGLIQYYSFQGSYFTNEYLRGRVPYKYKNPPLENEISALWKLIKDAPAFDKDYTLYRFVKDDYHIRDVKVGDTYTETSFISTTRDPFYRSDVYQFGFILIKIKVPGKIRGAGICLESISHFAPEQEIVLPPRSVLRLDRKDRDVPYYHTDNHYTSKIQTRYEFTWVRSEPIEFVDRPIYKDTRIVDFLNIRKNDVLTMEERLKQFVSEYANPYYQIRTKIGTKVYDFFMEWYDSMDAYRELYASRVNNGFSMYTFIDHYIGLLIELGEESDGAYMYVNYYFRHSTVPREGRLDDYDLLEFLAKVALYFEVNKVVVYAEYESCDFSLIKKEKDTEIKTRAAKYGGNYCIDYYNYLKNGKKRYSKADSREIRSKFSYYQLDRLKRTDPLTILRKIDTDEVYQIYKKTYLTLIQDNKKENNLADFYIWMVENYCAYVSCLREKMERLFKRENPWIRDYYIFNPVAYLYNRNMIDYYPVFGTSAVEPESQTTITVEEPKNRYRLDTLRNPRSPDFDEAISSSLSI